MKRIKQINKLAKVAERSAATDQARASEYLNLAAAFKAQADVMKKQKKKKKK